MAKGLDIVIKDVNFNRFPVTFDHPVTDGCLAWHLFAGDAEQSCVNFADNPDAYVVGSPVMTQHYASCKSDHNYFASDIGDTAEGTYLVVAQNTDTVADDDHRPCFIGSGSDGGGILYASAGGTISASVYQKLSGVTGIKTISRGIDSAVTGCFALRFGEIATGNDFDIYHPLTKTSAGNNFDGGAVRSISSKTVSFGSSYAGSSFDGTHNLFFAAVWSRKLTDAEIDKEYAVLKPYFARRAISI